MSYKKRIFFLLGSMNVGGVEKAFLNLIAEIPRDKYEIHLGLIKPMGGFMEFIPEDVKVYHIDCYDKYWDIINKPPLKTITDLIKKGYPLSALIHLFIYIFNKFSNNYYWLYKYILRNEPKFSQNFDIAIAFAGPSQMIDYYICEKVEATTKYGWIHFDVSKFGIDKGMTNKLYKHYSKIFIVSENAKNKFDSIFPKLRNKTQVFHNIVSEKNIKELSSVGESFSDSFSGVRILTVGRISHEKGHDIALKALKLILDKGYNVKWYFVGDGKFKGLCIELSKELGVEHNVVFLGTKTNPYTYMRDCDIYAQPSRQEGFCITLAEALCFDNPIVSTNFISASELLKECNESVIVDASSEGLSKGIINVINNLKHN